MSAATTEPVAPPAPAARRWVSPLIRIGFSALALYCIWTIFRAFQSVITLRGDSPNQVHERSAAAFGDGRGQIAHVSRLPWPKYPGARRTSANAMTWNQVPVLNEELEVQGTNERILSFYRQAMMARGWRDNTEEHFGLTAIGHARGTASFMLQNETYLRQYDKIRGSYLSLRRGAESILIRVQPGSKSWKRTVTLKHMETGSVFDFTEALRLGSRPQGRTAGPVLSSSERIGDDLHTTRFYSSRQSPEPFFHRMLARLEREGWRQNDELEQSRRPLALRDGHYAYLFRDNDFAMLMVQRAEQERGSQAVVTQIDSPPVSR